MLRLPSVDRVWGEALSTTYTFPHALPWPWAVLKQHRSALGNSFARPLALEVKGGYELS